MVDIIRIKPRMSRAVKGTFSHRKEKTVAARGSTQAYRLAFSDPIYLTPSI